METLDCSIPLQTLETGHHQSWNFFIPALDVPELPGLPKGGLTHVQVGPPSRLAPGQPASEAARLGVAHLDFCVSIIV